MIYIYDIILKNTDKNAVFERYGAKYKLEAKHKMGTYLYYTFTCPGMETLMVVPQFMQQYTELERVLAQLGKGKTYEKYRTALRKVVEIEDEDEYPSETSTTKVMKILSCSYKDIGIVFEFENNEIHLTKEFEIRQNNIFGNGQTVSLIQEEEQ